MNRLQIPIPGESSHDEMQFNFDKNASERDKWTRVFPRPLPEPYELRVVWLDDWTISIKPVLKNAPAIASTPVTPEPTVPDKHPSPGSPTAISEAQVQAKAKRIAELEKKDRGSLKVIAAELDVHFANSLSPAQMAVKIVEAEEKKKLETAAA